MKKQIICKGCEEFREHYAKGLCHSCYDKKWQKENPEKANAKSRKWNYKNPKKVKVNHRKWVKENPERVKAFREKWVKENPEKEKARKAKWYSENKGKVNIIHRKYRLENPGKIRELRLKRYGYGTVKKGVIDRVINSNILKYGILTCENTKGKKEDGHCRHCENGFHIDHIIPISKGGSNNYNNLQILCAHCNLSKHTDIVDYRDSEKINKCF